VGTDLHGHAMLDTGDAREFPGAGAGQTS
jgi:hypothetical protein